MRIRRRVFASSKTRTGQWLRLVGWLGMICVLVFVVAPALSHLPWVKGVQECTREAGIDPTTLFYTETEAFSSTEFHVRHHLIVESSPDTMNGRVMSK